MPPPTHDFLDVFFLGTTKKYRRILKKGSDDIGSAVCDKRDR